MKLAGRALLSALVLAAAGSATAQQTITFTNSTNPGPVTVSLLPGSTLGIGTNGNVTAQCLLDSGRCVGMPTGGTQNPNAPTVSIVATSNGQPITGELTPPASVTITPTTTNAQVCVRIGAGAAENLWTGVMSVIGPETVSLSTGQSTYGFTLKCYGDGGSATSQTVTVITAIGSPPPAGCEVPVSPPQGYTLQDVPQTFPQMPTLIGGNPCGNFPNTNSALCLMLVNRARYLAVQFTAPLDLGAYPNGKVAIWQAAQSGGEADVTATYVTISTCPGDFRRPTSGTAPTNDPTFAHGCRNLKFMNGLSAEPSTGNGIAYTLDGVSTSSTCGLTPGRTYYMNYILADPRGGIDPGEHNCGNNTERCGLQIRWQ